MNQIRVTSIVILLNLIFLLGIIFKIDMKAEKKNTYTKEIIYENKTD